MRFVSNSINKKIGELREIMEKHYTGKHFYEYYENAVEKRLCALKGIIYEAVIEMIEGKPNRIDENVKEWVYKNWIPIMRKNPQKIELVKEISKEYSKAIKDEIIGLLRSAKFVDLPTINDPYEYEEE